MSIAIDNKKTPAPDRKENSGKAESPGKLSPEVVAALQGALKTGALNGEKFEKRDEPAKADDKGEQAPPPKPDLDVPDGYKKPSDDKRTAQEIIDDNPTLRNLSDDKRKILNDKLGGDYTKDADRAYAASRIVEHIEKFDAKGNEIGSGKGSNISGNGKLDGYGKGGRVDSGSKDSEASRYENFGKDGFDSLVGDLAPPKAPSVPDRFKKPEDDKRDAQKIIDDSPALKNLGQNAKDMLKEQLGDYEKDPDKAVAASKVVAEIERFDGDGKVIKDIKKEANDPFNGKIDGFTKSGEAKPNTEAGRLQDFGKFGFERLKGDPEDLEPQKEGKPAGEFAKDFEREANQKIIDETELPEDRADIVANPDKYSKEQRLAAKLELENAAERIASDPKLWDMHNGGREVEGHGKLNGDAKKVLEDIQKNIDKVDSPEVFELETERKSKVMQEIVQNDPGRKSEAEKELKAMLEEGKGLEDFIKKAKGNVIDGTQAYLQVAKTLNVALGKDGKPLNDLVQIDVKDNPELTKKLADSFAKDFQDPETLSKLIKGGKTEQEALDEMTRRAALFSATGAPEGAISSSMAENSKNFMLGGIEKIEDLEGSGIIKDGKVDEESLAKAIEEIRKSNPEALKDPANPDKELTTGQILAAVRGSFDAFRNYQKTHTAANKAGMSLGEFMKTNTTLQKTFGSGSMHFVSGAMAAGIGIARGAPSGDGKPISPELLASAIGSGIQAFGLGVQGSEFTQRGNPTALFDRWGSAPPGGDIEMGTPEERAQQQAERASQVQKAKDHWTNVMNFGKVANGVGGMMAGATGIALGVEALENGDKGAAGVYLGQGISNTLTATGPLAEALATRGAALMGSPLSAAQVGRMFATIGSASFVLNIAAAAIPALYSIVDSAIHDNERKDYDKSFMPTLEAYGITGGPEKSNGGLTENGR